MLKIHQCCGFGVCCPVVCMCLCFASGCGLCKSWSGASSQPGGQTRKQMDLFGLNPSHATSSSRPSSSNLHVSLQNRRKGAEWECVCVVWGIGGVCNVASTKQRKQEGRQIKERGREREREKERERDFAVLLLQTVCVCVYVCVCVLNCADIWPLPPCWNFWSAPFLCRLS